MSHHHCDCGCCSNLISLDQALSMSQKETIDLYNQHLNAGLVTLLSLINFDTLFAKAEGVSVFDSQGNEYLDFLGGYGSLNLGHNHPEILEAVQKVSHLPNILQASINNITAALAKNLAEISPGKLKRSFFCNSGAEAVEGALKLAKITTSRHKIIYCHNSFHGKTLGALSVTGRDKYQNPFKPLLHDCVPIPFGDLSALQEQLSSQEAAAFIVEPLQGEGGIIEPPPLFMTRAKKLCSQHGTLFIADEVQTGLGRTGDLFACQLEDVTPDILCLAKSLGGGLMPVGAYLTTDEIWRKAYGTIDKALLHTSTFGGNTASCAAALKALEITIREKLHLQAREKGSYFIEQLRQLKEKYPLLKDVRGRGLLIGIEFHQPPEDKKYFLRFTMNVVNKLIQEYMGSLVAGELYNKHRIITAYTLNNPNVIRLEPPLTVTKEQIDRVLEALEAVLSNHTGFMSMVGSGTINLLQKIRK